jgi:hypothetical protein
LTRVDFLCNSIREAGLVLGKADRPVASGSRRRRTPADVKAASIQLWDTHQLRRANDARRPRGHIEKGSSLKNLLPYRHRHVASVGLGLCAVYAGMAAGQGLPSVPGITDLQKPVASTVQTVCIALNGLGGKPAIASPNPNGTPTERLSNSCTLMV